MEATAGVPFSVPPALEKRALMFWTPRVLGGLLLLSVTDSVSNKVDLLLVSWTMLTGLDRSFVLFEIEQREPSLQQHRHRWQGFEGEEDQT